MADKKPALTALGYALHDERREYRFTCPGRCLD
jgi:hypothetical protein